MNTTSEVIDKSLWEAVENAGTPESTNSWITKITPLISGIKFNVNNELTANFRKNAELIIQHCQYVLEGKKKDNGIIFESLCYLRALGRAILMNHDFVFATSDIIENLAESSECADNNLETCLTVLTKNSDDLDTKDIQGLGKFLNLIIDIQSKIPETISDDFSTILSAVRSYTEKIIMEEADDKEPLVEAAGLLKAMWKAHSKSKNFAFDISDVLFMLKTEPANTEAVSESSDPSPAITPEEKNATADNEDSTDVPKKTRRRVLDDDDIEIMNDFVLESRENLERIEVHLIDLEQTPGDKEILNAIFRPFHTIKGVSGFLDLPKINQLAHHTENLFDSSLKGDIVIDNDITDIILESVDILQKLLGCVEEGAKQKLSPDDDSINIKHITTKIQNLLVPSENEKLVGQLLLERGEIDEKDLDEALEIQKVCTDKKIGNILIEGKKAKPKSVIEALRDQKKPSRIHSPQVKVDTNKLDNLVDLTGELVIAQSMLRQHASILAHEDQKLLQNLNQLGQTVSNIQRIAMSMRMVPISTTFQRMVRLVRDLSKTCNKQVRLEMTGEDTEIDRTMVEALYEPMVHMIRNSIDHGLETFEERKLTEKDSVGTINLKAYHKAGNIIIEIIDDGKGLNKKNIIEKAVSKNMIKESGKLNEAEIFNLIMQPGFSTAKEITDISGRGVGMDVVKKAIEDLNGRIDIRSAEGKGTTFTIALPLTLAIIEGMLVKLGNEKFIIPTMAILEAFRPSEKDYYTVEGKGEMIMFRNRLIPLVRISKICDIQMQSETAWENIVVVVENKYEQRGILLEELLGKEEFVIKSLGETFRGIKGLAGGAILGDGRIGLILDIGDLFELALNY
jgi:two-component system chemotaxis sensor kinase CheA